MLVFLYTLTFRGRRSNPDKLSRTLRMPAPFLPAADGLKLAQVRHYKACHHPMGRSPCLRGQQYQPAHREDYIMTSLKRVVVSLLAATSMCGAALADMKTEIGPGEGQVDIVAWPGYI